jgi:hypothetical protein
LASFIPAALDFDARGGKSRLNHKDHEGENTEKSLLVRSTAVFFVPIPA